MTAPPLPTPTPVAERRLVSVLFADLAGFTPVAEERDPEEVREILSTYFDRMREIVSRHGGTIEKFIGDAVMAVWGTPVAHEDDAERAVRAALTMTSGVAAINRDLSLPDATLELRVAVLTGEAAITVGAEGQGMVAGDLVNTASRVQSVAPPGTVLVDEATRRASDAAVLYQEAGTPQLKGKSAPVPVWRPVHVVAGRRGAGKALGLEAPFVGRDEELGLVVELFHATAREGKARLVSVTGVAGIGKSRLGWEFEKYIDGLAQTVLWHRGRCLAYGEGVTYWALAEMVRMRARILEDEESASTAGKLGDAVAEYLMDPEERAWVEPRLAHLLGLESKTPPDRQELFAAWRLFFERLSDADPVAMVFEDLQWADAALLDFIEYLLDWSRNRPIYVLTLARPELMERRPAWGAGTRAFTSLFLEPLPSEAMDELVRGLVPGLPDDMATRIRDRAEGVPLYAVETVRMLLDRGLIRRDDGHFVPTGESLKLDVPETLQSLIAARLDALAGEERSVLKDASVLGKTFTARALASVSGVPERELQDVLESLTRKELLSVETNPLSPERGQYGFLQALTREVAYATLSRRERKSRHLAVARYLESTRAEEEEIVQIVASHYLEAYRVLPDAPDSPELRDRARESLTKAGERAASLAAPEEARRYFERALELAEEPLEVAQLTERTGEMAWGAGRGDEAIGILERAWELFESQGGTTATARVSTRLAEILWDQDRIDDAIERLEAAHQVLSKEEPDEGFAKVAAELGRLYHFRGDRERSRELIEEALRTAATLRVPEVMSQAMNTKNLILWTEGRSEEAVALLRHALTIAQQHQLNISTLRAYNNLEVELSQMDLFADARDAAELGLALARRLGMRFWEWQFLGRLAHACGEAGDWERALTLVGEIPPPQEVRGSSWPYGGALISTLFLQLARGDIEGGEKRVHAYLDVVGESHDVQTQSGIDFIRALVLAANGDHGEALAQAEEAVRIGRPVSGYDVEVRAAFVLAVESALELGDLEKAQELVDIVASEPPGELFSWMRGQLVRFRARLAAARGETKGVEPEFKEAAKLFREIGSVFWLAVAELEHAEWLAGEGDRARAEELLNEAREIFQRLGAKPWVERADRLVEDRVRAG